MLHVDWVKNKFFKDIPPKDVLYYLGTCIETEINLILFDNDSVRNLDLHVD